MEREGGEGKGKVGPQSSSQVDAAVNRSGNCREIHRRYQQHKILAQKSSNLQIPIKKRPQIPHM